jgi:uncharacterized protein YqeY
MLRDTLQTDLNNSLKAGKRERVETLRFLLAAINNFGITKYSAGSDAKITDADVLEVVKKQVKTHKESIEAFQKAGRKELVGRETVQLDVLQEYAPKEITDAELMTLLTPIAASGEQNFGLLMKQAMAAVGGRADGGKVASLLKQMQVK